jgi:hypothetical protein
VGKASTSSLQLRELSARARSFTLSVVIALYGGVTGSRASRFGARAAACP